MTEASPASARRGWPTHPAHPARPVGPRWPISLANRVVAADGDHAGGGGVARRGWIPLRSSDRSGQTTARLVLTEVAALTIANDGTMVDVDQDGEIGISDRVHWTITVSNSGATTVTDVTVNDPESVRLTAMSQGHRGTHPGRSQEP